MQKRLWMRLNPIGREDDVSSPGQADGALAFGDGVMLVVVSLAMLCSVGLLASGF